MGVGQIRPVVKCRAPSNRAPDSPRRRGKSGERLPPWDCAATLPTLRFPWARENAQNPTAAAENTPRTPPAARGEKRLFKSGRPPSTAALPARGKTRDPASAPKEHTGGDCFSPGLRAMAETKSRAATRRNDGAIPRPSDGRAGFFLPIGSEWLTTGAWTPCEP